MYHWEKRGEVLGTSPNLLVGVGERGPSQGHVEGSAQELREAGQALPGEQEGQLPAEGWGRGLGSGTEAGTALGGRKRRTRSEERHGSFLKGGHSCPVTEHFSTAVGNRPGCRGQMKKSKREEPAALAVHCP